MFELCFTQRKEHISQQWQNRAQQDTLALKISSLMCTDALSSTVIFFKGSNLKKLSSYKQSDKLIGKPHEYKDMRRGWKMGCLYIMSLVYKHCSAHRIYLSSYANISPITWPDKWGDWHLHTSTSQVQNFSRKVQPGTALFAAGGTSHQREWAGHLVNEQDCQKPGPCGSAEHVNWDPHVEGLGPLSNALKSALPALRAKCTMSCLKAFMAVWVHLK